MLTVYQKKLVRAAVNRRMEQAKNDEIKRLAVGFKLPESEIMEEYESDDEEIDSKK